MVFRAFQRPYRPRRFAARQETGSRKLLFGQSAKDDADNCIGTASRHSDGPLQLETGHIMQSYAYLFLAGGLLSGMFTDNGIVASVARAGRVCAAIFAVLYIGTEGMALLGY